jgi:integrase
MGRLRWQKLHVSRSVWRSHVGDTKTLDSEASVPVLPILKSILDLYRAKVHGSDSAYIFAGAKRGTPLVLNNLANRIIKPIFKNNGVEWKGWHAFRRGLATNLISMRVRPQVVQAILRHSDLGVTLAYYDMTPESDMRDRIQLMESALRRQPQLNGLQHSRQEP